MPNANKKKRATILDVARLCGLSKSTVAYIISKNPEYKASENSIRLVEEAVKALGYRPNHAAKSLSGRRSYTIGVLIPISGSAYYATMALNIQMSLIARGYSGLFSFWGTLDNADMQYNAVQTVLNRQLDGIISWIDDDIFLKESIPAVFYGTKSASYDSVMPDYDSAVRKALEYLTGMGHRKIGFVGSHDDPRNMAFRKNIPLFSIDDNPAFSYMKAGTTEAMQSAEYFISLAPDKRPDALIYQCDDSAIAAVSMFRRHGIEVPRDISIIGFDNVLEASETFPNITTFDHKTKEIADSLVDTLLSRIASPEKPLRQIIVTPEMIIRESCAQRA